MSKRGYTHVKELLPISGWFRAVRTNWGSTNWTGWFFIVLHINVLRLLQTVAIFRLQQVFIFLRHPHSTDPHQ